MHDTTTVKQYVSCRKCEATEQSRNMTETLVWHRYRLSNPFHAWADAALVALCGSPRLGDHLLPEDAEPKPVQDFRSCRVCAREIARIKSKQQ